MAKASELLEQSAAPFDEACMMVRQMEADMERLRAALQELVDLKDLKQRIEGWEAGSTQEMAELAEDYDRRKPIAWQAARDALMTN